MYAPKNKKLAIAISEELKSKIKGYAAHSNTPLGVFVTRILIKEVQKIEKGEHEFIKIEKKIKNEKEN